jgi:hypothetical protein
MLRMIAIEGGELARRRVPRSELVYPDEAENERVSTVLQQLIEARLLVSDKVEGEAYVEPAHDALIRAWDKLLVWSREAEEVLPLQRRLTQAASDWAGVAAEKEQQELLWHDDPRLPQLVEILDENALAETRQNWYYQRWLGWVFRNRRAGHTLQAETNWLNQNETHFVQQSVAKRLNNVRQVARLFAEVILILLAFSLIALILQQQAVDARDLAQERQVAAEQAEAIAVAERDIARSRQLAAESEQRLAEADYQQALLLAVEASRITDTVQATTALQKSYADLGIPKLLLAHDNSVAAAQWNADGSLILTGSQDHTARVWDVETGKEKLRLTHDYGVETVQWNKDESLILTSSGNRMAQVWDVETGTEKLKLPHDGRVETVQWNKDETLILTSSRDGTVRVWDAETGKEILSLFSTL